MQDPTDFSDDTSALAAVAREVQVDGTAMPLAGRINPRFAALLDAFADNFSRGQETGASFALYHQGRLVADLWGGHADAARTQPWGEHTLCNVMSVTKAMAATCLHLLVERGAVSLDAPVAQYWPEFAAAGKQGIRVRWLLDNRAGLPVLADDLWPGAILDWNAMTQALAAQAPLLPPGGAPAYHIRTAGFLVGELVRRVTGQTLGQFFRAEIAQPHGIDFHIGLQDAEIARCAEFIPQRSGTLLDAGLHQADSLVARAARQLPQPMDYNAEAYRRAEIPSTNGHGNGRSVARFYALLQAGRILAPATLTAALVEQHRETESVMGRSYRQALGYLLNTPGDFAVGPGTRSFGLLGAGGALGFADPDRGLGFGYVENRMHAAMGLGERAPRLIEAAYACIARLPA
jgi:CubicO group peptidase (beta-lactamase class C family)